MYVNITEFFNNDSDNTHLYVGNGVDGGFLWDNAIDKVREGCIFLKTDHEVAIFLDDMIEGGTDPEDIKMYGSTEANALFLQVISYAIVEGGIYFFDVLFPDWQGYRSDDNTDARLYEGDEGRVYYYIGV